MLHRTATSGRLRALRLLLLLALGCGQPAESGPDTSSPAPDAGAPSHDAGAPRPQHDAGTALVVPSCELEQLAPIDPLASGDVLATTDGVFLAQHRALFRARGVGGSFTRVTSLEPEGFISSAVAAGGSIFVLVDGDTTRVLESRDEGETWTDRSPAGGWTWSRPKLVTNGARLVAADVITSSLLELELDSGIWSSVESAPPVGAPDHFTFELVGFDGDALVANDVYGGGLVRLAAGATQWERIVGLGEWGYTSFIARDGLRITVNDTSIFTEVADEWRVTHALGTAADAQILDLGDRFLALDATRSMTSADGMSWATTLERTGRSGTTRVSRMGDRVVWRGGGALVTSEDRGETWTTRTFPVDDVAGVALLEGGVFAQTAAWKTSESGASWSPAPWTGRVWSFADDGAWSCERGYCNFFPLGTGAPQAFAMPAPYASPARIFATSHGVFVALDSQSDPECYGTLLRPGLALLDPSSGTIGDASAGLRADTLAPPSDCAGRASFWSVQNIVEVDGVLFASLVDSDHPFDTEGELFVTRMTATYRSDDGGAHWTEVSAEGFLRAAASVAAGIFALFDRTGLQRSTDGGASFEPVTSAAELGTATDLAEVDGALALSTQAWTGPSVWLGADGSAWVPLAELGPVRALDARSGALAIGTRTSGAWLASCR